MHGDSAQASGSLPSNAGSNLEEVNSLELVALTEMSRRFRE
jgi:hypothetical protein